MGDNPYQIIFNIAIWSIMLASLIIWVYKYLKHLGNEAKLKSEPGIDPGYARVMAIGLGLVVVLDMVFIATGNGDLIRPLDTIAIGCYVVIVFSLWVNSVVGSLGLNSVITAAIVLVLGWLANRGGLSAYSTADNALLYWVIGVGIGVIARLFFRKKPVPDSSDRTVSEK